MKRQAREKLHIWQERLSKNASAFTDMTARMDAREALYRGDNGIRPLIERTRSTKTPHVRNICAELIEAQVDSSIPTPKVTAMRAEDEEKARLIEDMLRNELTRLPMEMINDQMERTVPIQGGGAFLVEWDATAGTHTESGEIALSVVHPKQLVPQNGVVSGIEDMDYIILKVPQTKEYIKRRYGVNVADMGEEEPDIRGSEGESTADDMVTQYMAYYKNEHGGIGLYSWACDVEICDIEDYQARYLKYCEKCGEIWNGEIHPMETPTEDGVPGTFSEKKAKKDVCPYCGANTFTKRQEDFEEITTPILRKDGSRIEAGTRIPFYKPNIYPVILQRNVSRYGCFLGDSDLDKIESQQNTTNRIESKIIDKLLKSGSYITLPDDVSIKADEEDMKVIRPENVAAKQMIGVYDLEGNIAQDMAYLAQVYEEARQVIGITDSFQGRKDTTATSGKAKEFAAAQSAGRLESKRVMKDAAYSSLFEAIFKFKLAYADEPRPILTHDMAGNPAYKVFSKYDFLKQDDAGEWYWDDDFRFSCDTAAPLASNREAMWQETRMNLSQGAFGDPTQTETLIRFWSMMETLHYPMAGEIKSFLEEQQKKQYEMNQKQTMQPTMDNTASVSPQMAEEIERAARSAAASDMGIRLS